MPARRHRLGKSLRRRDLHRHRIVGIGNVAGPVDIDRPGDMTGKVFAARSPVVSLLDPRRRGSGHDMSPHVDDPQIGVAQMLGQPFGRDDKVYGHEMVSLGDPFGGEPPASPASGRHGIGATHNCKITKRSPVPKCLVD